MNTKLTQLSRHARYLETWRPQLEKQWQLTHSSGAPPFQYIVVRALQSADAQVLDQLRDTLRPARVAKREFLPDHPSGSITLPIATDVSHSRFLREVEGALDTHWNHSAWARNQKVTFKIRWTHLPIDPDFASGRTTLDEHLNRFPKNQAAMTTGGLSTFVRGHALVLGPGKITPRTLAHEIGHLMGFADCYFRTLSGRGALGTVVLEWDNPIYPDDLMCDNTAGSVRAIAW